MPITAPTDVAAWTPTLISTTLFDLAFASRLTLSALAEVDTTIEGQAGTQWSVPTLNATTPADNLAVTTAATDDALSGAGLTFTVKEAVKSLAFFDRTEYATGTDFDALAGRRGAAAITDRIELDLGAALIAGRNATADGTATTLTIAHIRAMKAKVPSLLRRNGLVLLGTDALLNQLLEDTAVQNAATFGSDEAIREGAFSRPIAGVTPIAVDDSVLPTGTGGKPYAVLMAKGSLIRAVQVAPTAEVERDARARMTRVVTKCLHAEGVVDPRGVVASLIGA